MICPPTPSLLIIPHGLKFESIFVTSNFCRLCDKQLCKFHNTLSRSPSEWKTKIASRRNLCGALPFLNTRNLTSSTSNTHKFIRECSEVQTKINQIVNEQFFFLFLLFLSFPSYTVPACFMFIMFLTHSFMRAFGTRELKLFFNRVINFFRCFTIFFIKFIVIRRFCCCDQISSLIQLKCAVIFAIKIQKRNLT